MKKILAITLTLVMMLSFAACGKDKTPSVNDSSLSDSSIVGTESTKPEAEGDKTENVSSKTDAPTESKPTESAPVKTECAHKYSAATCTTASKCSLCGVTKGNALGHSYSAGKCTRCGAADANYATYRAGGKDSIIRTTAGGKTTNLKIDISKANTRFQNISSFATSPSMDITYTKFLELDGWLFFAQTINMKYTVNGSAYDVIVDEVYKIKTDGTSQTALTTYRETADKAIGVSEVFGFDSNNIYYVLENEDEGICEIYKAPVSNSLTNLTTQGTKVASSPTPYATMWKCSAKDGYLYFSEKQVTYDMSISAAVTKMLGSYKIKTNGTGLSKIS